MWMNQIMGQDGEKSCVSAPGWILEIQAMFHLAFNNHELSCNPRQFEHPHGPEGRKDLGLTTWCFKNSLRCTPRKGAIQALRFGDKKGTDNMLPPKDVWQLTQALSATFGERFETQGKQQRQKKKTSAV